MAILSVIAASMALATSASVASVDVSLPANGQEVCADLSTGHMSASGTSVEVTAPAGKVIVETCVKAGSDVSVPDGAVVYATYNPGVDSVTLYGPGGKDISHWSARWADAPTYEYAGTGTAEATECTLVAADTWKDMLFGPITVTGSTETQGSPWTDEQKAVEDAKAKAAAQTQLADLMSTYTIDLTGAKCEATPTTEYTGHASVSGDIAVCTAESTNAVVPFTTGDVTRTSMVSQVDADTLAQTAASAAAPGARAAALSAYLEAHPGAAEGVCPVTPPPTEPPTTPPTTPTEPETVAPVLPATVEEPVEPETVSVPLPATVEAPTNVPAGDGSSSTQVPSGAIALAGVGLVGLAASTAVILRRRSPVTGDTR